MGSVSPSPHDALDSGHALMEAMRETAVGFTLILIVVSSCDIKTIIEAISLLNPLYVLHRWDWKASVVGCPVVVAQWQSTGCISQVSWVWFPVAADLFTFLYFRLITSKFLFIPTWGKSFKYSYITTCFIYRFLSKWSIPMQQWPVYHLLQTLWWL